MSKIDAWHCNRCGFEAFDHEIKGWARLEHPNDESVIDLCDDCTNQLTRFLDGYDVEKQTPQEKQEELFHNAYDIQRDIAEVYRSLKGRKICKLCGLGESMHDGSQLMQVNHKFQPKADPNCIRCGGGGYVTTKPDDNVHVYSIACPGCGGF